VLKLLAFAIIGFFAQLIDGALGMAYGVSSTTLLLTVGIAPAAASASVHLAEIATTLASGTAHWRFGNVDWKVVSRLAVPGGIGAFVGAVALSSLSAETAEPWMAGFLFVLGLYVIVRFSLRRRVEDTWAGAKPLPWYALAPLGGFAGFMDAAGGGGWGPISTPALLSSGRMEPRKVVGSVDTGEFLVSLGASLGFLFSLGSERIEMAWVGALLVGGVLAAPLAAWIVRKLPPRILGSAVGSVILITNAKTIVEAAGLAESAAVIAYAAIVLISLSLLARAVRALRRDTQAAGATA
jgi:uncharacterized protein